MLREFKIIIVRTIIIMYSIVIFSCSNYDMIAEKERETTAVYEPKTNVGKTLNAFDKAQKKL
ncbi:MAG TPA: hypothetical protein PK385_11135 [Spirochaetota bacterium]|nr:hypothetical protein [Spirochaetota bacterium]HOS56601.1 hypothetical protein [Spirochaetota bacterium]HQF77136.1 hypothetical protein [Spirochaetota bacterium]